MIYALRSRLSRPETSGTQTSNVFMHVTLEFYVDDPENDALPSKKVVLEGVKRFCERMPGNVNMFYAGLHGHQTGG